MRKLLAAVAIVGVLAAVAATLALAGTRRVSVGDNFYSRSVATIHKGSRVKWVWGHVGHRHSVTELKGRFSSRTTSRDGYTYTHTFRHRGTYRIYCKIHPNSMRMKVRVL